MVEAPIIWAPSVRPWNEFLKLTITSFSGRDLSTPGAHELDGHSTVSLPVERMKAFLSGSGASSHSRRANVIRGSPGKQ